MTDAPHILLVNPWIHDFAAYDFWAKPLGLLSLAAILRAQADRERTVILAEGYAEAQSLRGEGEALAIKIYAEALEQDPEFYAFTRRLDAYEITLKEGDTIVIPVDSDFFRYLTSGVLVPAEEAAGE